jgi:hypothetical protein
MPVSFFLVVCGGNTLARFGHFADAGKTLVHEYEGDELRPVGEFVTIVKYPSNPADPYSTELAIAHIHLDKDQFVREL